MKSDNINSLTAERTYFFSGYQVGKEIIGTTVNTLLFAYLEALYSVICLCSDTAI